VRTLAIVSYLFLIAATFNSSRSRVGSSALGPARKQYRTSTCYVLCSNHFAENRPAILSSTLLYASVQPRETGLGLRCYDVSSHVYCFRWWRELREIFGNTAVQA